MRIQILPFACVLVLSSAVASAFVPFGEAPQVAVPNAFAAGTVARATEVNANFQSLADSIRLRPDAENTLHVATGGADFTSIATALGSITDNSTDNPYLVIVFPGVYTETDVAVVGEGVHLMGFGANTSILETDRFAPAVGAAAAAVDLRSGGRVSGMTIRNDGAASGIRIGLIGVSLDSATVVEDATIEATGTGGTGNFAIHITESDLTLSRSRLFAEGASIVNSALGCIDNSGPFAQPRILDCDLEGVGVGTGIGMQISRTAATVRGSRVKGFSRAISATIAGSSRLHDSTMETLGLEPWAETNGSASVLSKSVDFIGGNALGLSMSFKYVHCAKPNFDPVVNGLGSSVQ